MRLLSPGARLATPLAPAGAWWVGGLARARSERSRKPLPPAGLQLRRDRAGPLPPETPGTGSGRYRRGAGTQTSGRDGDFTPNGSPGSGRRLAGTLAASAGKPIGRRQPTRASGVARRAPGDPRRMESEPLPASLLPDPGGSSRVHGPFPGPTIRIQRSGVMGKRGRLERRARSPAGAGRRPGPCGPR